MSDGFFKWDENKHPTHVDAMDKQHRKLFDLMNKIHTKYESKSSFEDIKSVLNELEKFAHSHFEQEEKYFDSINYPQASVHKQIHKDLKGRMQKHMEDFEKTRRLSNEFFLFLKSWLGAHIAGIDTKYSKESFKKAN